MSTEDRARQFIENLDEIHSLSMADETVSDTLADFGHQIGIVLSAYTFQQIAKDVPPNMQHIREEMTEEIKTLVGTAFYFVILGVAIECGYALAKNGQLDEFIKLVVASDQLAASEVEEQKPDRPDLTSLSLN